MDAGERVDELEGTRARGVGPLRPTRRHRLAHDHAVHLVHQVERRADHIDIVHSAIGTGTGTTVRRANRMDRGTR
jgi:NAD-dependent oxidoreductase involved in siderophore biosynthesis